MDDFNEHGKWQSALFVIIRAFDIMVSEALFHGIEWHMWLYYMPHIVKRCVRNSRYDDVLIDPDAERPDRYSFLIYEIVGSMCGWIEAVEHINPAQSNVVLRSVRPDPETTNISKSSILVLSMCVRPMLEATNISERFKAYIMDMVFELYFSIRSKKELEGYATVLGAAIAVGGTYRRRGDDVFKEALIQTFEFEKAEYLIKHPPELVAELEAALVA